MTCNKQGLLKAYKSAFEQFLNKKDQKRLKEFGFPEKVV